MATRVAMTVDQFQVVRTCGKDLFTEVLVSLVSWGHDGNVYSCIAICLFSRKMMQCLVTQLFSPELVHFQEEQIQQTQPEIEQAYFVDNREFKVLSRWEWRHTDSMQVWGVASEIGRLNDWTTGRF